MKSDIHGQYFDNVEVNCICGASFTISATISGPLKVETCYQCHPAFNKDKVLKKAAAKGRVEKFLEKQKRIDSLQK